MLARSRPCRARWPHTLQWLVPPTQACVRRARTAQGQKASIRHPSMNASVRQICTPLRPSEMRAAIHGIATLASLARLVCRAGAGCKRWISSQASFAAPEIAKTCASAAMPQWAAPMRRLSVVQAATVVVSVVPMQSNRAATTSRVSSASCAQAGAIRQATSKSTMCLQRAMYQRTVLSAAWAIS